jgi:TRAP-type transport system periplasmic protein
MRPPTLFLLVGLLPLLFGVGSAAAAEITAVTAWAQNYVFNDGVWELQRRVERKSGGTLKIKYKGGPEVVPPFEATAALTRGVFDMLNTSGAYYTQQMPESVFLDYFDGPVKPMREAGVFELFDKINQEKAGVKLLGVTGGSVGYSIFLKKPIQTLEDFKGRKIRATPTYVALVEGLGASPVIMPPGEIYTAMERGVVEGYTWPAIGSEGMKLYEVTCCMIKPFYWTVRTILLMNVKAWARLSPQHQKVLTEAVAEMEEWAPAHFRTIVEDEIHTLVTKRGMKVIELPEAEAKRFRQIAYEGAWRKWVPTSPKYGEQIRKMAEPFSKPWPPSY